jgi:transcriptional regulator with PAS, ATPase and Fis domain
VNELPELVGASAPMQALADAIASAAGSQAKVLLSGETGVGKEVVARRIHLQGVRGTRPFVTVNCAGVPDTLLESEFFGHARGSFTDAYADKPGLLRQADTGTVFLDEVGEMSLRMQVMLLRFLETGEIETVGGTAVRRTVDVRVIAATNRDLAAAVAGGQFRQDLYYRLNVLHVTIPPLRDRGPDIELLVRHYLEYHASAYQVPVPVLAPDALEVLTRYAWPGNVRELRNVAERIVLRASGEVIDPGSVIAAMSRDVDDDPGRTPSSPRVSVTGLLEQMLGGKQSFWTAVYAPFMDHDLTRDELREIVRAGLARTLGSSRRLVELFNMPPIDHQRLMTVLRQHDCDVRRRSVPAGLATA